MLFYLNIEFGGLNMQFINNDETKVLRRQAYVTLAHVGYPL
jgi:hypothetical protein